MSLIALPFIDLEIDQRLADVCLRKRLLVLVFGWSSLTCPSYELVIKINEDKNMLPAYKKICFSNQLLASFH